MIEKRPTGRAVPRAAVRFDGIAFVMRRQSHGRSVPRAGDFVVNDVRGPVISLRDRDAGKVVRHFVAKDSQVAALPVGLDQVIADLDDPVVVEIGFVSAYFRWRSHRGEVDPVE